MEGGGLDDLDVPLSDDDIKKALPGINIVSYPDLANLSEIPFDADGRLILLYLTESAHRGHWVCLFKRGNAIFFHDSYGVYPDAQLRWLSKARQKFVHESKPHLTRLLKQSGAKVYYSPYRLQSTDRDIATCGKHAIARLLNKNKSIDEFANFLRSHGDPDEVVEAIYEKLEK
jgi:hypothetical protein